VTDSYDDQEGHASYGLVLPFVAVKSKGGPHDDAAFVSGWRCGMISEALRVNKPFPATLKFNVQAEEVSQLDLVAMHHGWVMESEEAPYGWTLVTFTKGTEAL
jgi:hypothetical protein